MSTSSNCDVNECTIEFRFFERAGSKFFGFGESLFDLLGAAVDRLLNTFRNFFCALGHSRRARRDDRVPRRTSGSVRRRLDRRLGRSSIVLRHDRRSKGTCTCTQLSVTSAG